MAAVLAVDHARSTSTPETTVVETAVGAVGTTSHDTAGRVNVWPAASVATTVAVSNGKPAGTVYASVSVVPAA